MWSTVFSQKGAYKQPNEVECVCGKFHRQLEKQPKIFMSVHTALDTSDLISWLWVVMAHFNIICHVQFGKPLHPIAGWICDENQFAFACRTSGEDVPWYSLWQLLWSWKEDIKYMTEMRMCEKNTHLLIALISVKSGTSRYVHYRSKIKEEPNTLSLNEDHMCNIRLKKQTIYILPRVHRQLRVDAKNTRIAYYHCPPLWSREWTIH